MAISVPEAGTSVAPRQRPKGSAQPAHNLTLAAPPSPSPRNTVSSPSIPTTSNDTASHQQQSVVVETFATQFQANFPSVPSAAAPPLAITTPSQPSAQPALAIRPQEQEPIIEKMFQTTFPDPFADASGAGAIIANTVSKTPSNPSSQSGSSTALFTAALAAENAAATAFADGADGDSPGSITGANHMLGAPKTVAGHRRNMSDTSAFNK